MKLVSNYLEVSSKIEDNTSSRQYYVVKLVSALISLFIFLPIIFLCWNLIEIYYDLEIILMFVIMIVVVSFIMTYSSIYLDYMHKHEIIEKVDKKKILIPNLIISIIFVLIIFVVYLIARRF